MAAGNIGTITVNSGSASDMRSMTALLNQSATGLTCTDVTAMDAGDGTWNVSYTYEGAMMPYTEDMDNSAPCAINENSQSPIVVSVTEIS